MQQPQQQAGGVQQQQQQQAQLKQQEALSMLGQQAVDAAHDELCLQLLLEVEQQHSAEQQDKLQQPLNLPACQQHWTEGKQQQQQQHEQQQDERHYDCEDDLCMHLLDQIDQQPLSAWVAEQVSH